MKNLFIILTILFLTQHAYAQSLNIPKDVKYEVGDDYALFEDDVLRVANWMINGKVNDEFNKNWKDASAFLMKWIEGSPTVYIVAQAEFITYVEKQPALLMIFMAGWTKFSLENKVVHDNVRGNLAGLNAVIKFYERNRKALGEDKEIEKFIKMRDKGQLEAYIKKHAAPDKK